MCQRASTTMVLCVSLKVSSLVGEIYCVNSHVPQRAVLQPQKANRANLREPRGKKGGGGGYCAPDNIVDKIRKVVVESHANILKQAVLPRDPRDGVNDTYFLAYSSERALRLPQANFAFRA